MPRSHLSWKLALVVIAVWPLIASCFGNIVSPAATATRLNAAATVPVGHTAFATVLVEATETLPATAKGPTSPPVEVTVGAFNSETTPESTPHISPKLVAKRCPSPEVVPIGSLNVDVNTRLVIALPSDIDDRLWIFDPQSPEAATPIANSEHGRPAGISPSGMWFAHFSDDPRADQTSLWITALNGSEQLHLALEIRSIWRMTWLNDRQLGVYNEFEPIALVSPFDRTEQRLPSLGTHIVANFQENRAQLSPDGQAVVFLARELHKDFRWYLWDFQSDPQPVFPWISGSDGASFGAEWTEVIWLSEGITTITPKPYGADVAQAIPLSVVSDDHVQPRQIVLPDFELRTSVLGTTSDASWIALRQYELLARPDRPDAIYVHSIEQDTLYDYCLDLAGAEMPPRFSANAGHIALTLRSDPSPAATYEAVILDLQTGQQAVLRDMEVLDWGRIP